MRSIVFKYWLTNNRVSKLKQTHESNKVNTFKLIPQSAFCWIEVELKIKAKINRNCIIMMVPGYHSLRISVIGQWMTTNLSKKPHCILLHTKTSANLMSFYLSVVLYTILWSFHAVVLSFCLVLWSFHLFISE